MRIYKPRRKMIVFPAIQETAGDMDGIKVQINLSKNQVWRYAGKTKDGRTHLMRGQVDILLTEAPLSWLFKEVVVKIGKTLLGERND